MKCFTSELKKVTNFDKLYLLPKTHKVFLSIHGMLVIFNCEILTEKCSEFLDYHLKSIIQRAGLIVKTNINQKP